MTRQMPAPIDNFNEVLNDVFPGVLLKVRCRWCSMPVPGPVPMHGGACWALATRCGWWDARNILKRQARRRMSDGASGHSPALSGGDNEVDQTSATEAPTTQKGNRRAAAMESEMETTNTYTDSGILFKNDRRDSEKAPDYKGTIDATCEKCGHRMHRTLAAWLRTARTGTKFMSLSFKPRGDQRTSHAPADDAGDDDLRF